MDRSRALHSYLICSCHIMVPLDHMWSSEGMCQQQTVRRDRGSNPGMPAVHSDQDHIQRSAVVVTYIAILDTTLYIAITTYLDFFRLLLLLFLRCSGAIVEVLLDVSGLCFLGFRQAQDHVSLDGVENRDSNCARKRGNRRLEEILRSVLAKLKPTEVRLFRTRLRRPPCDRIDVLLAVLKQEAPLLSIATLQWG